MPVEAAGKQNWPGPAGTKKNACGIQQAWRKRGARGAYAPPDFGRIEGAAGRAALLLAHPDF